jgi:hypothetical protein
MDNSAILFESVIKIMPTNAVFYIESPHEEFINAIAGITFIQAGLYIEITLTEENKHILLGITTESFHEYIQSAKIKYKGELMFEAYDGFEYGILSKKVNVSNSILKGLIDQGNCGVSSIW